MGRVVRVVAECALRLAAAAAALEALRRASLQA